MKRAPHDFDIATDATPDEVASLFPQALTVGRQFGVTILPFQVGDEAFQIEVATFREDLEYKDGRRPEGVKFSTAKADAQRRDFTVNALFMDPLTGVISDFVDGQKDIRSRILRTVGVPHERFNEDKLRLLRAVRFSAQLDFEIEPQTLAAIESHASEVGSVSRERVRDELMKLLKSPNRVKGLKLLISTGLLSGAFPDSAPFILEDEEAWLQRFSVGGETLSWSCALALFLLPVWTRTGLHDFKNRHLKSLKIDGETQSAVEFALKSAPVLLSPSLERKGVVAVLLKNRDANVAIDVANICSQVGSAMCPWPVESDRTETLNEIQTLIANSNPEPWLGGGDMKNVGISPGPKMGEALKEAWLLQLEGHLTSKAQALAWLKDWQK